MLTWLHIDMGTSNSRFRIYREDSLLAESKSAFNLKSCEGYSVVVDFIKQQTNHLLKENDLTINEIDQAYASGMITSALGLEFIPHISTPVTTKDLRKAIIPSTRYALAPQLPLQLITGIKHLSSTGGKQCFDVIRGEEVELFGMKSIKGKDCLVILPGTHNKIIRYENDRIKSFQSSMSGELFEVIVSQTILKESLESKLFNIFDVEWLNLGYQQNLESGLSSALFHVRLQELTGNTTGLQLYSYVLGCVLADDIKLLSKTSNYEKYNVVIGGQGVVTEALKSLIEEHLQLAVTIESSSTLASMGVFTLITGNLK